MIMETVVDDGKRETGRRGRMTGPSSTWSQSQSGVFRCELMGM